ncbi:MAG: hypothetical protein OSB62_02875 [Alphaproteobacteria bacterium]|nr:hypothetical protein [Alphaproteobacteria bacterium]
MYVLGTVLGFFGGMVAFAVLHDGWTGEISITELQRYVMKAGMLLAFITMMIEFDGFSKRHGMASFSPAGMFFLWIRLIPAVLAVAYVFTSVMDFASPQAAALAAMLTLSATGWASAVFMLLAAADGYFSKEQKIKAVA